MRSARGNIFQTSFWMVRHKGRLAIDVQTGSERERERESDAKVLAAALLMHFSIAHVKVMAYESMNQTMSLAFFLAFHLLMSTILPWK